MKINRVRRRGKTITITGSFQREDLQKVIDLANKGAFEPPNDERIFNRRQPDGTFRELSEFFKVEPEVTDD